MLRIAFAASGTAPLAGTVALGCGRGRRLAPSLAAFETGNRLRRTLKRIGFTGETGEAELFRAPPGGLDALIVLGLGGSKRRRRDWRAAGGALLDALDESGAVSALAALDLPAEAAAELAYGLVLKGYRPTRQYRTRLDPDDEEDDPPRLETVTITTDDPAAASQIFAAREAVAEGVFLARDLTNEPGNRLGPEAFAERARQLEALGVEVTILDEAGLAAAGLALIQAVGQGSTRPPCLVLLRWPGADEPPLVLVGKGITFDSGGLSIKADDDEMEAMKADMAGAAAVLGALRAVAGRRARSHVVGVLALAENMPSGHAQRPGDVWTSAAGLTVEVIDTDAEGRLVLADALAYAARHFAPRAMVDIATLTGTVEEVLGDYHAGLYANDDRLAKQLLKLGQAEGEPLWRLPITESCDEDLKSAIADLRHCAWGDEIPDNDDAARFLWHFVPPEVPWAHIDMAGKEFADDEDPLCPEGTTGFGVRLFDALAGA